MRRYVIYLCGVLKSHGVVVDNPEPALLGPVDPQQPGVMQHYLQAAARKSYIAGKCAPQLICIILPGR